MLFRMWAPVICQISRVHYNNNTVCVSDPENAADQFTEFVDSLPVHDESVGDDHFVQIVFVMSGDTEKTQIVAFLVIGDLK